MTSLKSYHVVPPGEMGCVWMTAGILSYRLCDRNYNCDGCILDAALRNQFKPQTETQRTIFAEADAAASAPQQLRADLRYGANHCWMRDVAPSSVRIGLEPSLCAALLTPKAVVYPGKRRTLKKGQTCLWIVTDAGTLPIDSPLDGTLKYSNPELLSAAHLLSQDPFDRGWLFDMERDSTDDSGTQLMGAGQARIKYAEDENRLMASIAKMLRGNRPQVGITLADGGRQLPRIADILGPGKYFSLLRQIYD